MTGRPSTCECVRSVTIPFGLCGGTGRLGTAVTRFFADPFVERYSPTAVARVLLGVLGAGVLLVFFAPSGWLALVGFAMMGIGTSVIFPLAMSAAAQLTDRPGDERCLAGTGLVCRVPAGTASARLHRRVFWHSMVSGIGLPLVILSIVWSGRWERDPLKHEVE